MKKPTIKEIEEYCKGRNNSLDAESFYYFYESKGWMVGKNKMKSWQAAVITWEKRDRQAKPANNARFDIKDDKNVLKTGRSIGVEPKPGESSFDYARRVLEAKRL
jgi:hypothetical protein